VLFLGLTKAASYVAGSGSTVDEKSGMSCCVYVSQPCYGVVSAACKRACNDRIRALIINAYLVFPLSLSGFFFLSADT
jgi:hypothetical protein